MAQYLRPSIYADETADLARSIKGATTAETGIIGFVDHVNMESPMAIDTWHQFAQAFSEVAQESFLGQAVRGFFENGGDRCHVLLVDRTRGPAGVLQALKVLEGARRLDAICIPDLVGDYRRGLIRAEEVRAAQRAMIAHCELMGNRMAILDGPSDVTAQEVHEWRTSAALDSKFAALYWPWIKSSDLGISAQETLPPSGHIAGTWARTDAKHGVHRAPANEVVRGVIGLEAETTSREHDLLRGAGINVIRSAPGKGIRSWGARTLSSDPAFRFINIRRLLNYLETSIVEGTRWVITEPNDAHMWRRLVSTIATFLTHTWRQGALFGATPDQAFYVKCDDELNPPDFADEVRIAFEIGVAPVKPSDFVVFRIIHSSESATVED